MVPQNLGLLGSYIANSKLHILAFILFSSRNKNKLIHGVSFLLLPEMIPQNLGLQGGYIKNFKLHIFTFLLPSSKHRNKQINDVSFS
jgi:hypothetical protein